VPGLARGPANAIPFAYNNAMPIGPEIRGQKYVSLITFRKNGTAVPTPVWFGETDDKLYVLTRSDSGKYKRIRNNPEVRIAPCTMRGKVTGPEFAATARILPAEDWPWVRKTIHQKYWLARISSPWSKADVYLEIEISR
jgi:PPOX class probable F420-dependent enzyme